MTAPAPDPPRATRAWVIHPDIHARTGSRDPARALDEAASLAAALPGLEVAGVQVVRLPKVRPGLLFGDGKVEELSGIVKSEGIDLVLIDGPVTPVQQRNLERALGCKLLDRTGLILEIFSDRARTAEGSLQVEMAALSYQRTRLVRAWTHLERQRGGLGFVGGPGETQIEADRRAIDDQLARLRRQLAKVAKTRRLHRAARKKVPFPVVALVGYTNAGKSTLFNRLTGAKVLAKDMLFATLDPTMRGVLLPNGTQVILSDTVGFISNLPTQLVAAFRATLEEVLDADLILHVRDISHPETEEQAADVRAILTELGVADNARLHEIWNKTDLLPPNQAQAVQARAARDPLVHAVSALTGAGFDEALTAAALSLEDPMTETEVTVPFADGRRRAWLFDQGVVTGDRPTKDGLVISVRWTAKQAARFAAL